MLLAERETTIRWDAEEKIATIWTNDPASIKRFDILCDHKSGAYQCVNKLGQSATYRVSAKLISFRFPTTEELIEKRRRAAKAKSLGKAIRGKKSGTGA